MRRLDAAFVDAGVVERTSPGTATLQFAGFVGAGAKKARTIRDGAIRGRRLYIGRRMKLRN